MDLTKIAIDPSGTWHYTIFAVLIYGIFGYAFTTFKRYPESVKLLWIYVAAYAVFILEWPGMPFWPYTYNFQSTAGQVIAEIILIPLIAMKYPSRVKKLLPYAVVISLMSVWFNVGGLLGAPSFNSAFAACALPFLSVWFFPAVLITALTHHGSTALLIIGAQCIALALKRKETRVGVAIILIALGVTAYIHSGHLFNASERIEHYKQHLMYWAQNWRTFIFGVGPGSFMWISVLMEKKQTGVFLQMHSDWLQILFEEGLIGFWLGIWVFIDAVRRVWRSKDINLLSALFGIAVFAIPYYPLRHAPTALLTAYIFVEVFS